MASRLECHRRFEDANLPAAFERDPTQVAVGIHHDRMADDFEHREIGRLAEPREPFWPAMELQLRSGISAVLQGEKTAKAALDAVAADWQRSLRRAGIKPT